MILRDTITGMAELELFGADLLGTLSEANGAEIGILHLNWIDDLTCRFRIPYAKLRVFLKLAEKRGDEVRICGKVGLYWSLLDRGIRPVLFVGMILFLILSVYLSGCIFFVEVEGNITVPTRMVLEAAEKYGVSFGTNRRDIRSEQIKNGILSDIPKLQWVGVNTSGCVATISVRERTESNKKEEVLSEISQIVAARDGYIISGTTIQGTQMFAVGETVQEGQLLISGYSDHDRYIRLCRAEGEVYAQTNREVTAIMPSFYWKRDRIENVKHKVSLLIGKKRINLWKDSGICDITCGRMYKEYYITLPGKFRLPVALCVESFIISPIYVDEWDESSAEQLLRDFSEQYLRKQMTAGEIQNRNGRFFREEGRFIIRGHYICKEMISMEQIGEINGKNN